MSQVEDVTPEPQGCIPLHPVTPTPSGVLEMLGCLGPRGGPQLRGFTPAVPRAPLCALRFGCRPLLCSQMPAQVLHVDMALSKIMGWTPS